MSCRYRHIFGKEKEGVHSTRLLDVAVYDFIGTVVIGLLLSHLFGWNIWRTLLILFIISLILHKLFCVQTTWTKFVFGLH